MGTEGKKRPYKLGQFATEWKEPHAFASAFAIFLATKQIYHVQEGEQLESYEKSEYEGQPALRLLSKRKDGIKTTIYLDRETFQLLYSESDKSPILEQRGTPGPEKTVTRIHYRDVGGKRYPTRHEQHRVQTDGVTRKLFEHDITEYAPYTPTADELDLEKRFGVKPIPHEPRPASAMPPPKKRSSATLWYIAAGCLAVIAVGLVFYARRRAKRQES